MIPAPSNPTPTSHDFDSAAQAILEFLRKDLGFEMAVISRRDGEQYLVLRADDAHYGVREGDLLHWPDTFCARMVSGEAPNIAPDISSVPAFTQAAATLGMDVGAYLTYPMRDATGEVLGTVCAASPTTQDASLFRFDRQLRLLTDLLSTVLRTEQRAQDLTRRSEQACDEGDRDQLTGIGNRRLWDRMLASEEERCRRYGLSAVVVLIDLDGLKLRNDHEGHAAGDGLIRDAAQQLAAAVRDTDVIARVGGGEFAVLLTDCRPSQADALVARLVEALAQADIAAAVGWSARTADTTLAACWAGADADMHTNKELRTTAGVPTRPRPDSSVAPSAGVTTLLDESAHQDVGALLRLARQHMGMPIAFINRVEGGTQHVTDVEAEEPTPLSPGPLAEADTYSARVLAGTIPHVVGDTLAEDGCEAIPATHALGIRAFVGVPIVLADGSTYGTLCCYGHEARPDLNERDVAFLASIADAVSHRIDQDVALRRRRHAMVRAIDRVIDDGLLRMVFQPVISLASGELVGYEALARFTADPPRTPDVWFAEANEVGMGTRLEQMAITLALEHLDDFAGLLGINVSAATASAPGFVPLFETVAADRVVLELTEHEAVTDYDALHLALAPLRARGMRLAVDDVGAGFASLTHVLRLAPDSIKLDRSLVTGMGEDPSRAAMAAALAAYAARTGASTVAEGIETHADLAACREVGITHGQGWLLGRPGDLPTRAEATAGA